jgi:hypothetical protein
MFSIDRVREGGGTDGAERSDQNGAIPDFNIRSGTSFPYNKIAMNNWRTHPW